MQWRKSLARAAAAGFGGGGGGRLGVGGVAQASRPYSPEATGKLTDGTTPYQQAQLNEMAEMKATMAKLADGTTPYQHAQLKEEMAEMKATMTKLVDGTTPFEQAQSATWCEMKGDVRTVVQWRHALIGCAAAGGAAIVAAGLALASAYMQSAA